MKNYYKIRDASLKKLANGTKVSSVIKQIDKEDLTDREKELVIACALQKAYNNRAIDVINNSKIMGDAVKNTNMAERLNEYTQKEKFNLALYLVVAGEYTSCKRATPMMNYVHLMNFKDLDDDDFELIESINKKNIITILRKLNTSVVCECKRCHEKKPLNEMALSRDLCSKCKNISAPSNQMDNTEELVNDAVNGLKQVSTTPLDEDPNESLKGNSQDVPDLEDIDQLHEINAIRIFYTDVCNKLVQRRAAGENVSSDLRLIGLLNNIIKEEIL